MTAVDPRSLVVRQWGDDNARIDRPRSSIAAGAGFIVFIVGFSAYSWWLVMPTAPGALGFGAVALFGIVAVWIRLLRRRRLLGNRWRVPPPP